MKCVLILVITLSVLCLVSTKSLPARNGMIFYQSAPGYNNIPGQRALYMQYCSPNRRRSSDEGAVAAFAAGETIAAGTYLKDCKTTDSDDHHDDEHVSSVADAYPEQFPLNQNENVPSLDEEEYAGVHPQSEEIPEDVPNHKTPKELVPTDEEDTPFAGAVEDSEPTIPAVAQEVAQVPANVPAVVPGTQKKIRVEIEDDDDDDDFAPSHTKAGQSASGTIPANSYFPIHFGSTNGGAIAVANSFSTGKGGTATSTATAYGSPAKPRTKKRLVQSE